MTHGVCGCVAVVGGRDQHACFRIGFLGTAIASMPTGDSGGRVRDDAC